MGILQKNQKYDVEITDTNNLGYGVCRINGQVVFVNGGVKGDVCRIKIIKVLKSYAVAICDEIYTPSKHRVSPKCQYKQCGGCVFHNISLEYENELKRDYIKNSAIKAGLKDIKVENVLCADNEDCGYRNKAQYPLTVDKNGRICAGFYASHTHTVVPCDSCYIAPEVFSDIIRKLIEYFEKEKYTVYNEITQKGLLRHVYLRYGEQSGQIMLCLVVNGKGIPNEDKLVQYITSEFPNIATICLNFNTENTNVVLSPNIKTIFGSGYIEDILCGKRFCISPLSFYQVNRNGAEVLYNKAKELMGDVSGDVIDLYCGIGTVGICIASDAKRLIGVEIVPQAVEDARINAELNSLKNCSFYAGDASEISQITSKAECIIVDPPRKGLSNDVIDYIVSALPKKVIYISCDPDTLIRDMVIFSQNGYTTDTLYPVNMFPRTQHVESVVCLTRRLDVDMRR
ncbi:MAG: 23S rRNA (uracil(1939)-C(5))-methyltransferase RlmD [Clostridia bacterium]|nr:23S rRNA (uracil(1939)-C(5))-methyltransferase RlmD [Clostridia bacterium]